MVIEADPEETETSSGAEKASTGGCGDDTLADHPSEDELQQTFVNGTAGNDTIDVVNNPDGTYKVVVNGQESSYSAEEAERLVINGGLGNDTISIHQIGNNRNVDLVINGGNGNDIVYGGADGDVIFSGEGNDWVSSGGGYAEPFNSEYKANITYNADGTRSVSYGDGCNTTVKINLK
ncbi:MAG: hypothetical protein Q4Q25_04755 [Methanocorpusculum sp.]|nr:hypothetical protein [Methanocorpusculum sp.]